MTCRKCRYEFCWVCMGKDKLFKLMIYILTFYNKVPGPNMALHGITVIDLMKQIAVIQRKHNLNQERVLNVTCM